MEGPADEFEALRARLLTRMRRQPGDMRALMRSAEGLSRMAAAEKRLSPKRKGELSAGFQRLLGTLLEILPPDVSGQGVNDRRGENAIPLYDSQAEA